MCFYPPQTLLCCYRDFPTDLLLILGMSSGMPLSMRGRAQAQLTYFYFQSKVLYLLVSSHKPFCSIYVFCALLQLYISAVLSWVPCRLRSVCHQYDTPELLFLSSLPWINNKNVTQRAGVKIQDKMDLMVLWNHCQACASSLAAQLGKPKAEGLTLPEWWGLFSCLLPQLCLTDVIILSSSVCKWTVILVQVIKRRHSADNWQIEVRFEPKPLERPARYYFQQNGSWLCNLCSLAPPPIQIIVGLRVLFNKFK